MRSLAEHFASAWNSQIRIHGIAAKPTRASARSGGDPSPAGNPRNCNEDGERVKRVRNVKSERKGRERAINSQDIEFPDIPLVAPLRTVNHGHRLRPKRPPLFRPLVVFEINNVDRVPLFNAECSPSPLTENALLKSNQIAKGYTGYGASASACTLLGLSEICWVHALRATDGHDSPLISCDQMESSSLTHECRKGKKWGLLFWKLQKQI